MEDRQRADDDHRQLQGDVCEREDSEGPLAAAAGDVEDVEQTGGNDHGAGDDQRQIPGAHEKETSAAA